MDFQYDAKTLELQARLLKFMDDHIYPNEKAVEQELAANTKAGVLVELARQARYPILLVNDSDIRVAPGYLRAVAAPLSDPRVGLVTCLYRATGGSWPARAEALGIATEFAPSVLVARAAKIDATL